MSEIDLDLRRSQDLIRPDPDLAQCDLDVSRNELIADAVVHGLGLAAALVGTVILLREGMITAAPVSTLGIYAFALIAMLACSAANNLILDVKYRDVLRRLDYAAIFFMVAANYTPFTTEVLHGAWSVGLTALIWTMALGGIALKAFLAPYGADKPTALIYLAFGWVGLVAAKPMIAALSPSVVWLIAVGGALYSVGTVFFTMRRLRYRRAIWHTFVVAGASAHFVALFMMVTARG